MLSILCLSLEMPVGPHFLWGAAYLPRGKKESPEAVEQLLE